MLFHTCLSCSTFVASENTKEFWNSFVNSGQNKTYQRKVFWMPLTFFFFNHVLFFFEIVHLANLRPTCQFLERVGNTVSSLLMERKWTLQPLVFSFAVRLALDKDDIGKLSLGKTSVISSNQPNRRGWRQLFQTDWWAVNLRSIYSFRRTIYQCSQMLNLISWKNWKKIFETAKDLMFDFLSFLKGFELSKLSFTVGNTATRQNLRWPTLSSSRKSA